VARRWRRGPASPSSRMIIAIDGPAAAGKGTLAARLAAHYRLPYLDTGLLYRGVARIMADRGLDVDDPAAAANVAAGLDPTHLDDPRLRGHDAGELASLVAVHPGVRAALLAFQQRFARQPAGAVLDGRDIGTAVCPDADVKIYVTASPQVRAQRRTAELSAKGRAVTFERILAEIRGRDARDAGRLSAPLALAKDAIVLDTTGLNPDGAFAAALAIIEKLRHGAPRGA
jgi:cytidylate kinase